ncbi:MAG: methyltransferase domain-containing protein [Chitinophagaceae bacterium]|nr:MAG: methyltransferase domain-containing protein [Chitinophagaceae bacterium]
MIYCPICSKSPKKPSLDTRKIMGQQYTLFLCAACKLQYWEPRQTPDKSLYENDFEDNSVLMQQRHAGGIQALPINHAEFITRHPNGEEKSLFDVGCGDGVFLAHAQKKNWIVAGIDFDMRSITTARKRGLNDVQAATIEDILCLPQIPHFDAVTTFEVLEHQSDPAAFLSNCKRLLRPGGLFAGSVPNRERFTFLVSDKGDLPPYHFTRWSKSALSDALFRAGFVEVKIQSIGTGYYLRNLSKPLKVAIRNKIASNVAPADLATLTIEDLPVIEARTLHQVYKLKALKRLKQAIFRPGEIFEHYLEQRLDKGQMLYFEARLPT